MVQLKMGQEKRREESRDQEKEEQEERTEGLRQGQELLQAVRPRKKRE